VFFNCLMLLPIVMALRIQRLFFPSVKEVINHRLTTSEELIEMIGLNESDLAGEGNLEKVGLTKVMEPLDSNRVDDLKDEHPSQLKEKDHEGDVKAQFYNSVEKKHMGAMD